MTDADDLSELRNEAESGTRFDSTESSDTTDSQEPLAETIVAELDRIDAGQSPNVTIRDRNLAALLRALEQRDELDTLGQAFDEALGNDVTEEYTKAEIGRLGIRIALENEASDSLAALEQALVDTIDV